MGSKIEESAGETIPIGGAGLIVAYSHSVADTVEPAVTRAIQKAVGEAEGHHVQALKGAIADAQKKMAEEGQSELTEGRHVASNGTPHVLFVYYSFTQQTRRVADTMADTLRGRGYDVTEAAIEFTDPHYGKRFSKRPMSWPIAKIIGMLPAQVRRKTGDIKIPAGRVGRRLRPGGHRLADVVAHDLHAGAFATCTIPRQDACSPVSPSRCSPPLVATTRTT